MRVQEPRIEPVSDADASEEQAQLLQPYRNERGVLNVYRTMAREPKAARGFLGWGRYVLRESTFDAKLRELAILRVGWLCRSGYEWTQHSRLARTLGMSDETIERITLGPKAAGWSELEVLVLSAADELHADSFISAATWSALKQRLSETHMMDLVFTVGHYTQVCMILNTFGVQVEPDQSVDPRFRTPNNTNN